MSETPTSDRSHPVYLRDGKLIRSSFIPEAVREARQRAGLSREEAAEELNITDTQIKQAELHTGRPLLKLRKQMLTRLAGFTLEGPYYRVRRVQPSKGDPAR